MTKPDFVYVTYIESTPEKVWSALQDGEMTKLFWGRSRNVSDWKVGSSWSHQNYDDEKQVDVTGMVVEADPPRRLVLTWKSTHASMQDEKPSRVTFEIQGRSTDADDPDIDRQCVALVAGPFENEIERYRRRPDPHRLDHAIARGAQRGEEVFDRPVENAKIGRIVGDAGRVAIAEAERPDGLEGGPALPHGAAAFMISRATISFCTSVAPS